MYYEERIINGILMYRTHPDSAWSQCSIEKMSQRIVEMKDEISYLKSRIQYCKDSLDNALIQTHRY